MHGKGEIMGRLMMKIKNKQYGQAMAEFALTIPVFLLLVFGIIELSRFFLVYSSVYTASREATRFGSSVGEGEPANYLDCDSIAEMAVNTGWFGGVTELSSDKNEVDKVNIYYESSPGDVVGACKMNIQINGETQTLINYELVECAGSLDNCSSNPYSPDLGDRVVVEIVSTYRPLLGIVPEMPVRSTNGRTIMQELKVYSDPVERIYCYDVVEFSDDSLQIVEDENKVLIHVINDSTVQHYIIYEILNIDWDVEWSVDGEGTDVGLPDLKEIRWNHNVIWTNTDPPEKPEELGEDNQIIDQKIDILWTEWDSEYSFSLPAKIKEEDSPLEVPLEFVFFEDGLDFDNLNFSFDLIVVHSGFSDDKCNPVGFGE